MRLRQVLLGCPTGLLRKIAGNWGLPVEVATLRSELVDRLSAELRERAGSGELARSLDDRELLAVGLVESSNGRQSAELLERRLRARLGGDGPDAATALAGLVERGVLFRVFEAEGPSRGMHYVVPAEYVEAGLAPAGFGQAGPGHAAALEVDGPGSAQPEPLEVREADPRFDCFALASTLRREAWNRAAAGLFRRSGPSLEQVLTRFQPSSASIDPATARARSRLLVSLGRRMGWLSSGAWPAPDDERVEQLLDAGPSIQRTLWTAYLASLNKDSRSGGGDVSGHANAVGAAPDQDVLQLLAELPPGRWTTLAALQTQLTSELDLAAPNSGDDGVGGVSNRRVQPGQIDPGSIVRSWLAGPLYWLGLVRWGRTADGWTLVATTPSPRQVAGLESPAASVPSVERCTLSAELQLVAPPGADPRTLYRAERFLSHQSGQGGPRERRYRLAAASFARGVRLGGSAGEALELFATLGQTPVPEAWTRALSSWESAVGHLRLEGKVVLTAADPETMQRALDVPGLADHLGERLSERHAVVDPVSIGALLNLLSEAGQPVVVETGLRLEPGRPARAASLDNDAAELLWTVLEALARYDRALLAQLEGAAPVRSTLEAVLPAEARSLLGRRAESLVERIRLSRGGRRGSRGERG